MMEFDWRAVIVVATVVAVMAVAVLGEEGNTPSSRVSDDGVANDTEFFVSHRTGPASVFMWGFQRRNITIPGHVKMLPVADQRAIADMLAEKEVAAGYVSIGLLGTILRRNPDARILPYIIRSPPENAGIYARKAANISSPEDLKGVNISLPPGRYPREEVIGILEDEHAVKRGDIGLVTLPYARMKNASRWKTRAALVYGNPDGNNTVPIFFPGRALQERYGSVFSPAVFVVADPSYQGAGRKAINAVNRSILMANRHRDAVLSYLSDITGLPPTAFDLIRTWLGYRGGHLVAPMTRGSKSALRYRYRFYADRNGTNISGRIIERPR